MYTNMYIHRHAGTDIKDIDTYVYTDMDIYTQTCRQMHTETHT